MEEKTLKIEIPEGFEIDKDKSSFEKIVFKKKEKQVKTWTDLIEKKIPNSSKYINNHSVIQGVVGDKYSRNDKNYFIDEKHAKSALAMAQISQLMPYYGGAITLEEWYNSKPKYIMTRYKKSIHIEITTLSYNFLAFHTQEQIDMFFKYNEQLVRDYLMFD